YLKDFVHGRSVDEESEQQDIDDDLFGKRFENDLLWLAREDVMKPSPSGGIACQKENGESYDFYFNTGKSSWNHPYDDIYKTRVIQAREKKTLSSIVFDTLSKVQEQEERKLLNKMKVDLTLIENNIRENHLHENKSLENCQPNELNNIDETIEREKQELQKKLNYLNLEQQNNTNIQIRLLQMKHEFDEKLRNVENRYKNETENLAGCYEQIIVKNDTLEKRLTEENDLLWLAREDVMKPSPSCGIACQKENEESYHFYFNMGKSSWDHPYDDIYKTRVIQAREKKTLSSIVFDTLSKEKNSEDTHERIKLTSLAAQTAEHPLNTNKSSINGTTSTIRLEQSVNDEKLQLIEDNLYLY
ncbi:unnamed protein product, partial [Rotaria sp. Silwood1]